MPSVYHALSGWRTARSALDKSGARIGFVPTMGALHAGHRALLERARSENDHVVLSIFVNPTQFDDPKDLERYPRTLEADLELCGSLVDSVLAPSPADLYPDNFQYRVSERDLSRRLEGQHRPGHFDGVLTVVIKLLNLVRPSKAYFGEKDWQQLQLVKGMVSALFIPVEIIACPTVREASGLALSSRNRRLSDKGRLLAARFPKIMKQSPNPKAAAEELARAGLSVDYVEDTGTVRLGAVRLEGIRLIDNVRL